MRIIDLTKKLDGLSDWVKKSIMDIVGVESVNYYHENFEKQSFDGKKWKDVKRRDSSSEWYGFEAGSRVPTPDNHPKRKKQKQADGTFKPYKARKSNPITNFSPTATKTKILSSQNSELANSIVYRKKGEMNLEIVSDKEYAKVHNEGLAIDVFGKKKSSVPQRQFAGESDELERIIQKEIEAEIKRQTKS